MKKFKYIIYRHLDGNGDSWYTAERERFWFNDTIWDYFDECPKRFASFGEAEMACSAHAKGLRQKIYILEIAGEIEA